MREGRRDGGRLGKKEGGSAEEGGREGDISLGLYCEVHMRSDSK